MSRTPHPVIALALVILAGGAVGCGGPTTGPPDPDTNSLFGVVRITGSEVLLEGVRVWVEGTDEDHTTPNGGYSLDGFDLGITRVFAELDGHEQYSRRVRIDPGANVHDIFLVALEPDPVD